MLWLGFILALVWPNADGHALARVTVLFTSCKECSARAAGISLRGAESNAPIIPDVIERRRDRLVLSVKPGYYRVSTWIASPTENCQGERFLAVLPNHDRRFDLPVRCLLKKSNIIGFVDDVHRMHGLAGTIPAPATAAVLLDAEGERPNISSTLSSSAYYFDEIRCAHCVLRVTLADGSRSTIGFDFQNAPRFGLFRRDLSSGAIAQGQRVHGSPFNAPETLVQGPQGSIWALDRLGNRVAVIGPGTAVHEYELPTPYSDPGDIIATRKFVWVVERRVAKNARFSSDGSRMEFALGVSQWYMLRAILGADERIWFTDGWNVNAIDESGKITRYGAGLSDSRLWVIGSSSAHGKHGPFASVMLGQNLWREFLLSFAPDSIAAAKTGFWIAGTLSSLSFLSSQGLETPMHLSVQRIDLKLYAVDSTSRAWLTDQLGNMLITASPDGALTASYADYVPAGISDIKISETGSVWIAEPLAGIIDEYSKGVSLPPRGITPTYLLFSSDGTLWYSDPDADVIGTVGSNAKRSHCYAFWRSRVKNCRFDRADIVGMARWSARTARIGSLGVPVFDRFSAHQEKRAARLSTLDPSYIRY